MEVRVLPDGPILQPGRLEKPTPGVRVFVRLADDAGMARHLDLVQQYAGTTGHCLLWALALREVLPTGFIARIRTTESEILERHDWPPGMDLVLHNFLMIDRDGEQIAVDTEGAHTVDEMVGKLGFRRRRQYVIEPDPDYDKPLDQVPCRSREAMRTAVELRVQVLRSLDWGQGDLPSFNGELARQWKTIARQALKDGVPEPYVRQTGSEAGPEF